MEKNLNAFKDKIIFLTGIKPTGLIHFGNYLGAIKPYFHTLEKFKKNPPNLSDQRALNKNLIYKDFKSNLISFFFIADYHALTEDLKMSFLERKERKERKNFQSENQILKAWSYEILASLLALKLNLEETIFYRQSDVPEIFELSWILSCYTPKGLINRTHAYKAKQELNRKDFKKDLDFGINMGLYSYPILMSSDILLFHTDFVPVGKDQIQHVEIARDIAKKFNSSRGEILTLPNFLLNEGASWIPGIDGHKMSKKAKNYIPIFCASKDLKKLISKIKTDSSLPSEPKDPLTSSLFQLYSQFASPQEIEEMKIRYKEGISWSEVKESLFKSIENFIGEPRESYYAFIKKPDELEDILREGAKKARKIAVQSLDQIRKALGLGLRI